MLCDRCGKKMVERVNSMTGEIFWGCSGWPKCRKSKSKDERLPRRTPPADDGYGHYVKDALDADEQARYLGNGMVFGAAEDLAPWDPGLGTDMMEIF